MPELKSELSADPVAAVHQTAGLAEFTIESDLLSRTTVGGVHLVRATHGVAAAGELLIAGPGAGNDGATTPVWLVAAGTVLAVGSPAAYANHGPWVDLTVPAEGVVSTGAQAGCAAWTGTSFAAPQITGELAARIGAGYTPATAVSALRHAARH
jgi:subtilisin family serine protease